MHQGKPLRRFIATTEISKWHCRQYARRNTREFRMIRAVQDAVKFASGLREGPGHGLPAGAFSELMSENSPLVR
jgi:hypothetical protein